VHLNWANSMKVIWRKSRSLLLGIIFSGCFLGMGASGKAFARDIDFGREIRPILSDKCFQCHGADEGTREAELRLDLREAAVAVREGLAAIVPGKPEKSLIVQRICSSDPDEKMPPSTSNKSLSSRQMELIREWVAQGAPYAEHWAFQPVRHVSVPTAIPGAWARNPIDQFIEARLQGIGRKPSPEADRLVLLRRIFLDLVGLLPSPEESAAFLADTSPDAYDHMVDRLLENPHYGERWGRHWLDQARYADSQGFTIDGARIMWPYRDWVIGAFNADLPFDQFTIEQLAGDLLPAPTKSQRVASAFHRNTMINQEGGVKPDQYRHEAIIDRVSTTGAVWLGLTIGCAQCHSHKFDPITHTEFYRLYAFFNQCADANNTGATVPVQRNEMLGWTPAEQRNFERLGIVQKKLKSAEARAKQKELSQLKQWDWHWKQADVTEIASASQAPWTQLPDGSIRVDQSDRDQETWSLTLALPNEGISAIRLRVLPDETLPNKGPGLAPDGSFFVTQVELQHENKNREFSRVWASQESSSARAENVLNKSSNTGWSLPTAAERAKQSSKEPERLDNELVLLLAHRISSSTKQPRSPLTFKIHQSAKTRQLLGRFAVDVSTTTPEFNNAAQDPDVKRVGRELAALKRLLPGEGESQAQMIMADLATPPATYRLKRGDFLQPAEKEGALTPGVPAVLSGDETAPGGFRNRLDLARWLVSPENPLTARVTVNRIWMQYFGRGLVETENDFGFQGSPPTHPELLDWLAGEFMREGWSMKHLHRLIVTSATYRQSSRQRADLETVDPRNLWLGHQSRLRVDAETLRDMALSASGRLSSEIGGPSVFPPQPDGVYSFTQTKKVWTVSTGADRYRRTLYTMFYRSAPHPLFTTFDSPDFSAVCTQRPRSNTPLQSLTLANDTIFVELAQGMAQRLFQEQADEKDQIARERYLFQLCLTRTPDAAELNMLRDYWQSEKIRYQSVPESARELAGNTLPAGVDEAEFAAWISLARVLMNTDEFVTRN